MKTEVTDEDLKRVFSKFGEVGSTSVKTHDFNMSKGGSAKERMGFGFVSFKTAEDAKKCYAEARNDEEVKALIHE